MKKYTQLQRADDLAYFATGNVASDLPPLILLHGLCEDHTVWTRILPELEPLGRIYSVDLPGFGASALPPEPEMAWYARAPLSVMSAEGVDRAVLVGHSMGGYAALQCAAQHGSSLAGLVLVHSHPFPDAPQRREDRLRSLEILEAGRQELYVRQLFGNLFAPRFAQTQPDVVETCVCMGLQQPTQGIMAAIRAIMNRGDHVGTLCHCSCPVLAILGDEDRLVPLEEMRRAMKGAPKGETCVLEGVGHMGMWEAPTLLSQHLKTFWQHLGTGSAY